MARRLEPRAETEAITAAFPSKHLPPVTLQDLPDAQPLRKVLGPGIIAAGVGLASGE